MTGKGTGSKAARSYRCSFKDMPLPLIASEKTGAACHDLDNLTSSLRLLSVQNRSLSLNASDVEAVKKFKAQVENPFKGVCENFSNGDKTQSVDSHTKS